MQDFLNNGKVLIGSRYDENPLKPKYRESEPDMLLLQASLIFDTKAIRRRALAWKIYMFTLVFGVFAIVLFH